MPRAIGKVWGDMVLQNLGLGADRSAPPMGGREAALIGLLLLVFALITLISTFGHPDLHIDEAFYFAAGVEMVYGARLMLPL